MLKGTTLQFTTDLSKSENLSLFTHPNEDILKKVDHRTIVAAIDLNWFYVHTIDVNGLVNHFWVNYPLTSSATYSINVSPD